MRLNKKYPEAYASGTTKYISASFFKCISFSLFYSVMEMNANQHDSLDDDDEEDNLASSLVLNRK